MNRWRARPTLALSNVEARERQEREDGSNIPGFFLARNTNIRLSCMIIYIKKRIKDSFMI